MQHLVLTCYLVNRRAIKRALSFTSRLAPIRREEESVFLEIHLFGTGLAKWLIGSFASHTPGMSGCLFPLERWQLYLGTAIADLGEGAIEGALNLPELRELSCLAQKRVVDVLHHTGVPSALKPAVRHLLEGASEGYAFFLAALSVWSQKQLWFFAPDNPAVIDQTKREIAQNLLPLIWWLINLVKKAWNLLLLLLIAPIARATPVPLPHPQIDDLPPTSLSPPLQLIPSSISPTAPNAA